jgi:oligopeptidase B
VLEDMVWAADSRTLFYIRQDPVTLQSGAVYRHERRHAGRPTPWSTTRPTRRCSSGARQCVRRFVLIDISGYDTSETRVLPLDKPEQEPARAAGAAAGRARAGRPPGRALGGAHQRRRPQLPPGRAPVDPARRETWRDLVPARGDATLERFELFEQGIAVEERVEGRKRRVRVLRALKGGRWCWRRGRGGHDRAGREPRRPAAHVQVVRAVDGAAAGHLDLHLASGREILRRQEQVPGLRPGAYRSQRSGPRRATARRCPSRWPGARQGRPTARAPLLLEGYGAYGDPTSPSSSPTACRCSTVASWSASRMCAAAPSWARPGTRLAG